MTSPAICSQCGSEMIFDGIHSGVIGDVAAFHCSGCEQAAHVFEDGHGGMTIATLFAPLRTAKEHAKFARHQAAEKRMFSRMRVVAGWLSEDEYTKWNEDLNQAVSTYIARHPSLWKKVRSKVA